MVRTRIYSGTDWEEKVGYSRAVRTGPHIHISGTTATDKEGEIVGENNAYKQTRQAIANIETALKELDASLADVVRTRLFVTDIDRWEAIGEAHADTFQEIRPTTSMVEINRLIDPKLLVEIEADAIVTDTTDRDTSY